GVKAPAGFVGHFGRYGRYRDQVVKILQLAEDQGAMRPGAGQRHIEVIAAGFGLEAADAGWAGAAISGYPIAEARLAAFEFATALFGVVPLGGPVSVDQLSQDRTLSVMLST